MFRSPELPDARVLRIKFYFSFVLFCGTVYIGATPDIKIYYTNNERGIYMAEDYLNRFKEDQLRLRKLTPARN